MSTGLRTKRQLLDQLVTLELERGKAERQLKEVRQCLASLNQLQQSTNTVFVTWELFRRASEACLQAWQFVELTPEESEGACENNCNPSTTMSEEGQEVLGDHGYFELQPVRGCRKLTLCSQCLTRGGPANVLASAVPQCPDTHTVQVYPAHYDAVWAARFANGD